MRRLPPDNLARALILVLARELVADVDPLLPFTAFGSVNSCDSGVKMANE